MLKKRNLIFICLLILGVLLISGCWPIENTYTVTYHGNGNTSGVAPTDANLYEQGATVAVLNQGSLVKSGYVFVGWNTAADGSGTSQAAGSTFNMGTANVTLYAQWTANLTYTVTYHGNGNTSGVAPTDANLYEQGAFVTVLGKGSLVKSGYVFIGWNTAAGGGGTAYDPTDTFLMPAANVTLYAQWTAINYTITFNKNDDAAGGTMTDQTIASGSSANLTARAFTKEGWTFAGWATSSDGGVEYADQASYTMGTANVILYAKWTPPTTYSLCDIGPAGGLIFYVKEGGYSDGWMYLEAAPLSTEWTNKKWGSYETLIGGTGTDIGTGQSNTTTIVTWLDNNTDDTYGDVTNKTDRAAYLCDALTYGSYSDWFLPSKGELNLMYTNLKDTGVGGFADKYYWSSFEHTANCCAWGQNFGDGTLLIGNKYYRSLRVRAVRAF